MNHSIYEIIHELEVTPGKNDKVEIIKSHAGNKLFLQVLDAALNTHRTYHIKQIPKVTGHGCMPLSAFLDNLRLFEDREITGDSAKSHLRILLESLSAEDAEIAARIIRKNLKAGFNASTVNKAIPGTIYEHPCLKASSYSTSALKKIKYPAYSQIKADGMRANIIIRDGVVTLMGRSGKEIHLHGSFDFVKAFEDNIVLDGEFILIEPDGSIMPRERGNGILNKAIGNVTISKEEANMVHFVGWDSITLKEFDRCTKKAPRDSEDYRTRWDRLIRSIEIINSPKLTAIENRIVLSESEANEHYNEALDRGEEGIILKNILHPYENRRSEHLVKFKVVLDCDLEIIGWNPGTDGGKWEDKIGSLICASSDRTVEAGVSSGLSHNLLEDINANFDNYLGKIVTVEYNTRIKHKTRPGIDSLFSPRFLEIRQDKDVADKSDDILRVPAPK